jgi:hypothetical protein
MRRSVSQNLGGRRGRVKGGRRRWRREEGEGGGATIVTGCAERTVGSLAAGRRGVQGW